MNGVRRRQSSPTNGNGAASDATIARFYERHYQTLRRFAYTHVHDSELAEDVVQQAIVSTMVAIRGGSRIDARNLSAWLHRCIHNLAVDHRRRPASDPVDSLIESDDTSRTLVEPSADERVLLSETWRRISRAIACLPPHFRQAFILAELRGLSYDEIATILNRSNHSVRQILCRARRHVREIAGQSDGAPAATP